MYYAIRKWSFSFLLYIHATFHLLAISSINAIQNLIRLFLLQNCNIINVTPFFISFTIFCERLTYVTPLSSPLEPIEINFATWPYQLSNRINFTFNPSLAFFKSLQFGTLYHFWEYLLVIHFILENTWSYVS